VPTYTLTQIETALRLSWRADTRHASVQFLAGAPAELLVRGQCATTALVVHDLLGGELLIAPVTTAGVPNGHHYWNRLPGGLELDLTREQFQAHEEIGPAQAVVRPPGLPRSGADAYLALRDRFTAALADLQRTTG